MTNCSDNLKYQVEYVDSCIFNTLNKHLSNTESQLLEGILKTPNNKFRYLEVVKIQYPCLDEERIQKIADNYKAYFWSLKQTIQNYYDNAPYLDGFEIKVTKSNFKRHLDTYILKNNASELLDIRISNVFCLLEILDQLEIDSKNIKNLELFHNKMQKIILICERLLTKLAGEQKFFYD